MGLNRVEAKLIPRAACLGQLACSAQGVGLGWNLLALAWQLAVSVATCALILVAACCLL